MCLGMSLDIRNKANEKNICLELVVSSVHQSVIRKGQSAMEHMSDFDSLNFI
jgi:hypothetical protein